MAPARSDRNRPFHRGPGLGIHGLAILGAAIRAFEDDFLRAGLGFVGKNGLIIAPGLGSFVLLGEVVTTLSLAPDQPMTERCGSCSLCLDACPTQAFDAPFERYARSDVEGNLSIRGVADDGKILCLPGFSSIFAE